MAMFVGSIVGQDWFSIWIPNEHFATLTASDTPMSTGWNSGWDVP